MLLHETVLRHALERPHATAVVDGERRISYRDLDDQSNQLARVLERIGCRAGDRVGLLAPKSMEAIVGMLGVLKAGGIYVPMDTRSPAARLRKIVEACTPACILAARDARSAITQLGQTPVGWLGTDAPAGVAFSWGDLAAASAAPANPEITAGDPAHILFTSGSTGTPKGVVVTHASVMHFLNWANDYFGLNPGDRHSGHPPLHFDLSTFDIYGTFLAGAELHLVPAETSLLPHKIADFIRASSLTQWFSVPSVLRFMAQFDVVRQDDFPELKRILWCGEALPTPTLVYWMERLPRVQFTNLYGPTETTIASSYHTVTRVPASEAEPIPIGVPCPGESFAVLDHTLQPVAAGEIGELYIGGAGLSPGYWNDPEKTAHAFRRTDQGERIYKTGDLARRGPDGLFYLLGRSDSQIKSRGYRIELGEIEASLHTLNEIAECAVVAVSSDSFDGTAICCAYVPSAGADPEPSGIRERLSALLPSYMLPSRWMNVGSLPLNANGKIDRPRVREQFETLAVSA